jgi:hypothetical protein
MAMSIPFLTLLGLLGIYFLLRGLSRGRTPQPATDPDAATLAELVRVGSDVTREHDVEFFLYLPGRAEAEVLAEQLAGEGFKTEIQPGEAAGDWLCLATRRLRPELDELRRLRARLAILAESRGGAYDGWGATVVEPGSVE